MQDYHEKQIYFQFIDPSHVHTKERKKQMSSKIYTHSFTELLEEEFVDGTTPA